MSIEGDLSFTNPRNTEAGDLTGEVTLPIGEITPAGEIKTPVTKEQAAHKIADKIVLIFGWAVLGSLALDFLLIGTLIWIHKDQNDSIEGVIEKGVIPLLTTTGTFASTLFGPLLAFILGYYFSHKAGKQQDEPKDHS